MGIFNFHFFKVESSSKTPSKLKSINFLTTYGVTQAQKITTQIIVKSIHLSLHLESNVPN